MGEWGGALLMMDVAYYLIKWFIFPFPELRHNRRVSHYLCFSNFSMISIIDVILGHLSFPTRRVVFLSSIVR